jgi:hypothetical protein
MNFLSGFKTVLAGLVVAAGPATIGYIGNVDVTKVFGLSPTAGAIIGAVMIGLRAITNSAIFSGAAQAPANPAVR